MGVGRLWKKGGDPVGWRPSRGLRPTAGPPEGWLPGERCCFGEAAGQEADGPRGTEQHCTIPL